MAMIHLRGKDGLAWARGRPDHGMYQLDVEGAGPLINRLAKFDKDVYRILQRDIRKATSKIRNKAQSYEPVAAALFGTMDGEKVSGGWGVWTSSRDGRDLGFDGTQDGLKSGMKVQVRQTRRRNIGASGSTVTGIVGKVVAPPSPAAAIFLLAGSRDGELRPGWGGNFNAALNARYGTTFPRGMTAAWREEGPEAGKEIDRAIERAKEAVT